MKARRDACGLALAISAALAGCGERGGPQAGSAPGGAPAEAPAGAPASRAPLAAAGPLLEVDASGLRGNGQPIAPLPADRSRGFDAAHKRSGPNDLYVVPLASALAQYRAQGWTGNHLVVVASSDTAYRVLIEVLFTAVQREVSSFEIREGSRAGRTVATTFPLLPGPPEPTASGEPALPPPSLRLAILVVSAGIAIKASGGNIAPGCDGVGAGIAIPRQGGVVDLPALVACVRKTRAATPQFAAERSFIFTASPDLPLRELMDVVIALRGEASAGLFPDVTFGVAR